MPPRRAPSPRPARVPSREVAAQPPRSRYDWLRLLGIQAYGHLGVTAKERELGQRVDVDVEIAYDPSERRADSIRHYIDYEEVGRVVRERIEQSSKKLIETLAEDLAAHLLSRFDTPLVRVRLRKLHIPVPDFSGVPEVEIERSRR
ncbi:MAG TPA: dihydroneopterin aldolase [Candidatus Eisenbacteria bacterium]|nr:dihydroneopterin aldolase [Candidatus Eisenbacteria bacterium]